MAVTLSVAATFHSGCSTGTSPSGNTTVGQRSSAAQTGETVKKGMDASSEKEAPAQDNGDKIVNVSNYLTGYSQLASTGTCRTAETNSMKDETEERSFKLIVMGAQDNTVKQVSDVEDLIAQNTDLLVLSLRGFGGPEMALQTAKESSAPVVPVDRLTRGEAGVDYVTHIATNFVWGRQAARGWPRDRTGGTCNIAELTETVGPSSAQDRATGSAGVVDQNEGMKAIVSQTGSFERSGGQKIVENLLQVHGDETDAVFCHNDQIALGAVQVIGAAGYKSNGDILIMGIDGEMGSFKSAIAGEMSATIVSSPMYGPTTFDAVKEILVGQEVPEQTTMEDVVVDAGNTQGSMELAY